MKTKFIKSLEEMVFALEVLNENPFKIRALRGAAQILETTEEELGVIASGKVKIKGIGAGIQALLTEFLKTGNITELQELQTKVPAAVFELAQVPGLGPKKAYLIHTELGVSSLGELEYACRENRLATLKGFGQAIQKKVLQALEKKQAQAGKLRLDQAFHFINNLFSELKLDAPWIPVGDLGKSRPICDQIEVLLGVSSIKSLQKKLGVDQNIPHPEFKNIFKISKEISNNDDTVCVVFWVVESANVSEQELYSMSLKLAVVAETGFDQKLQERFEKQKMPLSWLEPQTIDRLSRSKNPAWYQRSLHGKVRGIFHCHTNYSDGSATVEQMVKAAQDLGYEYIGISDHSQSAFYAQGLKEDRVFEQYELIQKLQKKFKIKIFHGIESDILADGSLDYPKKVLENFDFVIGSIHSRFKMNHDEMTKRILAAISNPELNFLGHPTGRLLLAREGYTFDWEECLKAAKKHDVCIELNANPHRLDVDWSLGNKIQDYLVQISINPDAHDVEGLSDTYFGELMAEKAAIDSDLILNLKSLDEVESFLK